MPDRIDPTNPTRRLAGPYGNLIDQAAQRYGVDPGALSAIAAQESSGNPDALNPETGARGLFQFIPATAKAYGIDPTDPAQAADAAARMFRDNLERFGGDEAKAIAAHFAGPDTKLWGPKTAQYVEQVRARMGQKAAPQPTEDAPWLGQPEIPVTSFVPTPKPTGYAPVSDTAKLLAMGVNDAVGAVGQGITLAGRGLESEAVAEAGKFLRQMGEDNVASWKQSLSPGMQAAVDNPLLTDDLHLGDTPIATTYAAIVRSIPSLVAMGGTGGLAMKGFEAAGAASRVARVLQGAAEVSPKAAEKMVAYVARGATFGGSQGVYLGLQAAQQAETQAMQTPDDQWDASPAFQQAYQQTDPKLPIARRRELAKENVAGQLGDTVFARSFVVNGGLGLVTGGGIFNEWSRNFAQSGLTRRAIAAGIDAPMFGAQGVADLAAQNDAMRELVNPEQSLTQGLPNAFASNAAMGAVVGGAMPGRRAPEPPGRREGLPPTRDETPATPAPEEAPAPESAAIEAPSAPASPPLVHPSLQPGDVGRSSDGGPFKSAHAAQFAAKAKSLTDSHEAVAVDGGFVLRPRADATESRDNAAPAQPTSEEAKPAAESATAETATLETPAAERSRASVDPDTGEVLPPKAEGRADTDIGRDAQGAPFASRHAADLARKAKGLGKQYGAVKIGEDQWVLRRRVKPEGEMPEPTREAPVAEAKSETPAPADETVTPVDEAAHQAATSPHNELPEPTQAQKESGNYQKGHVRIAGLDISIENPAGSVRRSKPGAPKQWETTMRDHYGYIRKTEGADGDHVDVFVKPGTPEDYDGPVFVVDQRHVGGRKGFDEHKVMLGFKTIGEAKRAYMRNYEEDWPGLKSISATTIKDFKAWLERGDTSKDFFGHKLPPAGEESAATQPKSEHKNAEHKEPKAAPVDEHKVESKVDHKDEHKQTFIGKNEIGPATILDAGAQMFRREADVHKAIAERGLDPADYDVKPQPGGFWLAHRRSPGVPPKEVDVSHVRPPRIIDGEATTDAPKLPAPGPEAPAKPAKAKPADETRTYQHAESMRGEIGWGERGGNMIRDPETGDVVGRTKWIPKSEFWPDRPDKSLSEKAAHAALDKAAAGERLKPIERRFVDYAEEMGEKRKAQIADTAAESEAAAKAEDEARRLEREEAEREAQAEREAIQAEAEYHDLTDEQRDVVNALLDDAAKRGMNDAELEAFIDESASALRAATEGESGEGEAGSAQHREAEKGDPGLELTGQTNGEILADEARAKREREAKAQQDNAPPPEGFTLTGSKREADVAAAHGQQDLLAAPKEEPKRRGGRELTPEERRLNSLHGYAEELAGQIAHESHERDFSPTEAARAVEMWAADKGYDVAEFRDAVLHELKKRDDVAHHAKTVEKIAALAKEAPKAEKPAEAKPKRAAKPESEEAPKRETITPAEDKHIGENDAGEPLYERADGSRYRMHAGRPDFGGDLVPKEAPKAEAAPVAQEEFEHRGSTWRITVRPHADADGGFAYYLEHQGRYGWEQVVGEDAPVAVAKRGAAMAESAARAARGDLASPKVEPKAEKPPEAKPKSEAQPGTTDDVGANLWANRRNLYGGGVTWDQIKDLNDALKIREVQKLKVWPRPDYEQLINEKLHPVLAHFAKQVYDAIATRPPGTMREAPTDAQLQRYLELVDQVRAATLDTLKAFNNKEFLLPLLEDAQKASKNPFYFGQSEAVKQARAALLDRVFPPPENETSLNNRFRHNPEYSADARLIGGNKALRAMQFDLDSVKAAVKAIAEGWPAKREAWETRFDIREDAVRGEDVPGGKAGNPQQRFFVHEKRSKWRLASKEHPKEGFATRDEAVEYARTLTKRGPSGGQDVRGASVHDALREGPARREAGENVSSQKLMDTFGFRGVNFGRKGYINDAERQAYLNAAYDGMHDLAELLGVPPKALSLNGELGIAFGAQGHGGHAAAHFVPGVNEINLTKNAGAGTLAHEWGHALDHYFATMAGLAKDGEPYLSKHAPLGDTMKRAVPSETDPRRMRAETVARFGVDLRPEILEAFRTIVQAMNKRAETPEEAARRSADGKVRALSSVDRWLKAIEQNTRTRDQSGYAEFKAKFDAIAERIRKGDLGDAYVRSGGMTLLRTVSELRELTKETAGRYEIGSNIKGLANAADHLRYLLNRSEATSEHEPQRVNTTYHTESVAKDHDRKGRAYWATPWEMFARAFERYVSSKLEERAQRNTFLSDADQRAQATDREGGLAFPYPRDAELVTINRAFDKLVGALETKETDKGVALHEPEPTYSASRERRSEGLPQTAQHIASFRNTRPLKAHADYAAAKAGDGAAAARLVRDLVRPDDLERARTTFGEGAIYAAPLAREATGMNAIPALLAERYAAATNGDTPTTPIVQANRAHHTGAGAMERMIARPVFEGPVERGARYVVVDDVTTMGGTLAELADHIRAGGGEVVGSIVLTDASRTNTMAASRQQIRQIEARFGDAVREIFHAEPAALTGAEAGYILGFRDADALRARAAKAEGERTARLRARGVSQEVASGKDSLAEPDAPYASAPTWYSELERRIDAKGMNTAPAAQWSKFIDALTQQGVKKDEIEWSGVKDWLAAQGGKVSKADVMAFVRDNGVRVEETMLGGDAHDAARRAEIERLARLYAEDNGGWDAQTPETQAELRAEAEASITPDANADPTLEDEGGIANATKFGGYTLPGGENYRELLLTLPTARGEVEYAVRNRAGQVEARGYSRERSEEIAREVGGTVVELARETSQAFQSNHFDTPNILAHVRFNDRTDAQGRRVLFLEEIQSDWAQQGRRRGFKGDAEERFQRIKARIESQYGKELPELRAEKDPSPELKRDLSLLDAAYAGALEDRHADRPPAAPFVGKTEAWTALALKRMVRYAAENGYDRIAWTTGEQQAARYALSKQISSLNVWRMPDDEYGLVAKRDGEIVMQRTVPERELAGTVGKDLADKIVQQPIDSSRDYTGLDLKIGGEGMRSFYDRIVPNVANDLLKKMGGGRVDTGDVPMRSSDYAQKWVGPDFTVDELRRLRQERYRDLTATTDGQLRDVIGRMLDYDESFAEAMSREGSIALADALGGEMRRSETKRPSPQAGFDITPELRAKALGGMAMFEPKRYTAEQRKAQIAKNERQLDLFAQSLESASGKDAEANARAGREAVAAVRNLQSQSSLLALTLSSDYAARQRASLVGHKVTSNEDLATLAQVYRDKRFESFRTFFVDDDGNIVAQVGLTSRMPASTVALVGNDGVAYFRALHAAAQKEGATGYYLLHNHPSGIAQASLADENLTRIIARDMPGFKGHVVLDHDQYVVIDQDGNSQTHTKAFPQPEAFTPKQYAKHVLTSPEAARDFAKTLAVDPNTVTLIGLDGQHVTTGIAQIPLSQLGPTPAAIRAKLFRQMRAMNATKLMAVSDNRSALSMVSRYVLDALHLRGDGNVGSLRETTMMGEGRMHPVERGVRVTPDTSPTFDYLRPDATFERRMLAKKLQRQGYRAAEPDAAYDHEPLPGMKVTPADVTQHVKDLFAKYSDFNWWHRTVGTQLHKAAVSPEFRPVYRAGQRLVNDTSRFALDAADAAPSWLPRLGNLKDVFKPAPPKADRAAASKALYQGTLAGKDAFHGKRFTDEELRAQGLSPGAIGLYHEARAAVDRSLDDTAAALAAQQARRILGFPRDVVEAAKHDPARARQIYADEMDRQLEAAQALEHGITGELTDDQINRMLDGDEPMVPNALQAARIEEARRRILEPFDIADKLKAAGYFPLKRWGKYTTYVYEHGEDGEAHTVHFSMTDSKPENERVARAMRERYPEAVVETGTHGTEAYKMMEGLSPDTLAVFAKALGADESDIFQKYLGLAISDHSALKHLMNRKGTPGFEADVSRTLAAFVTSNARLAARAYHMEHMMQAANAIPKALGRVSDEAAKLVQYLRHPQPEAEGLRSLMFMQYLGGSVASALTNATQPVLMTMPYLAQWGKRQAASALTEGTAIALKRRTAEGPLREALERAKHEGITDPHELHQLYAETIRGLGSNLAWRRFQRVWGSFFALAEQFNRETTFVAAWHMAQELSPQQLRAAGARDAYTFAVKAVEETQGVYNRGNRPNWARGPIGATLFTFKQFSIAYLEFLQRLPRPQQALALATLVAASGVQGLPFAEDLEDIIDTLGQALGFNVNSKAALRRWAVNTLGAPGDALVRGASAYAPFDMSTRLGLGNLIPGTAILKRSENDRTRELAEVAGPVGSMIGNAGRAFDAAQAGRPGAAANAMLPLAAQNLIKGIDMLQSGVYKDTRGRKVIDVDGADALLKAIGLQPASVARSSLNERAVRQDIAVAQSIKREIADKMANARIEHDRAAEQAAREQLRTWNRNNPDSKISVSPADINRRLREMKTERAARLAKVAPRGMRGNVRQELAQ